MEYTTKFTELTRFSSDFIATKKVKASTYFEGLNFKYQKRVGQYTTFQEIYDRALEQECIDENEATVLKRRSLGPESANKKLRIEPRMGTFVPRNLTIKNFQRVNIPHSKQCVKCGKLHRGRDCDRK